MSFLTSSAITQITSNIKPIIVGLNVAGTNITTADVGFVSNIVQSDVGVQTALANDKILLAALQSPEDFVRKRGALIQHFAFSATAAAIEIVSILNRSEASNATDFSGTVLLPNGQPRVVNIGGGQTMPHVGAPLLLGEEVADEMVRKLSVVLLSAAIREADSIFDAVKSRVLDKISNTRAT